MGRAKEVRGQFMCVTIPEAAMILIRGHVSRKQVLRPMTNMLKTICFGALFIIGGASSGVFADDGGYLDVSIIWTAGPNDNITFRALQVVGKQTTGVSDPTLVKCFGYDAYDANCQNVGVFRTTALYDKGQTWERDLDLPRIAPGAWSISADAFLGQAPLTSRTTGASCGAQVTAGNTTQLVITLNGNSASCKQN
jgi:hypothetical protein